MRVLILILTLRLSQLGALFGLFDITGGVVEFFQQLFARLEITESDIRNYVIGTLGSVTVVLASLLVGRPLLYFLGKSLAWLIRETALGKYLPSGQSEEVKKEVAEEIKYLKWLRRYLPRPTLYWQSASIVPIPAHSRNEFQDAQDDTDRDSQKNPRPAMTRYNSVDWSNPALKEMGLPDRDAFGEGAGIKNLVEELKRHKKTVVLGDPGSGKSVCLRQLAYDLCERELHRPGRPRTIPIYVEMGAYDGWDDESPEEPLNVLKFLRSVLNSHPSVSQAPQTNPLFYLSEKLEKILDDGRATLIFDALDEMPRDSYEQRYDTLKEFVKYYASGKSNRFIFSCRQLDYDETFEVNEVVIDDFDEKRIEQFLDANARDATMATRLKEAINRTDALNELARNPFFLQALTFINRDPKIDVPLEPATRGELVRKFVEKLLKDIEAEHGKHLEGGLPALRAFLAEVGFELQKQKGGGTSAHPDSLRDIWAKYPQWKEMLLIARRGLIMRGVDPEFDPPKGAQQQRIEFKHHRLQEYFAAEELARRFNRGEAIDEYLSDIWWQETVLFAVAAVEDPRSLIERMLSPREDTQAWVEKVLAQAKDPFPKDEASTKEAAVQ